MAGEGGECVAPPDYAARKVCSDAKLLEESGRVGADNRSLCH